eukprot:7090695-Lingulodinium_polyedra.AAC.1
MCLSTTSTLTECGARPSRWTTMLKQWREENQSLMVVDYVAEKTLFLSSFTVIVIDDYNSLDRKNEFGWEEGLDKEYKAWAEELSYFKNV